MNTYEQLFEEYVKELKQAILDEQERLERIREVNRDKFQEEKDLEEWIEGIN